MRFRSKRQFTAFQSPQWSRVVQTESSLNRLTRRFFSKMVTDGRPLVRQKNPDADLKRLYRKVLELSAVSTLALIILGLQLGRMVSLSPEKIDRVNFTIEVADIPQTEQRRQTAPPARPSIPVPTESEEIPEDLTIESTELNLDLASVPPPPPSERSSDDEYVFIPYDEPPAPIGGINQYVVYPPLARKAGFEGTVIVAVLIGPNGNTLKTQILKDSGLKVGFEEAAVAALQQVKWKPAKQRDRNIKVWMSFPIRFELLNL